MHKAPTPVIVDGYTWLCAPCAQDFSDKSPFGAGSPYAHALKGRCGLCLNYPNPRVEWRPASPPSYEDMLS